MFHSTEIVEQKPGYLEATVDRNYFGEEAIQQMVAQFPGLAFHGSGCTQACETIHSFEARGGEVAWTSQEAEWPEEQEERISRLADGAPNWGTDTAARYDTTEAAK